MRALPDPASALPVLHARLVRLDRPPGQRYTALFADDAGLHHIQTEFRECLEGETVTDGAGVARRVSFAGLRQARPAPASPRIAPGPGVALR